MSLNGTLIVARDIAHAKLLERVESGQGLPDYAKNHMIYYAGPAKTPEGYASGSFGPTTAGRMDSYVDKFMAAGGSFVTLAKGKLICIHLDPSMGILILVRWLICFLCCIVTL